MVWIPLLRELGAKYNIYDYSWDADDDGPSVGDPRAMDPIPEGIAGRLDQRALRAAAKRLNCPILEFGTGVLESHGSFEEATEPLSLQPQRNFRAMTRSSFLGCLWLLWCWFLLDEIPHIPGGGHEQIRAFAVFFTVPKSNGKLRTIMDCRDLNHRSKRPPPVNLGGMGECLRRASDLGCTVHIQADISHWFHHFGLPQGSQQYFGVKAFSPDEERTDYFQCRTMPMGWSWAPFVAQCAALTAILSCNDSDTDDLGVDYESLKEMTSLPPFIELHKGTQTIGYIQVIYDNVGIFLKDNSYAQPWIKRLRAAERRFNIVWKEMYCLDARGAFNILSKKPVFEDDGKTRKHTLTFLGVEMKVATEDRVFSWRHDPKKLEKWSSCFISDPSTPRQVAKIVGILVWDRIVALTTFATISSQIDALRIATKIVKTKADWDKPLVHDQKIAIQNSLAKEKIEEFKAALRLNPWYHGKLRHRAKEVILLASDATETSIAGVMLNEDGKVVSHCYKHGMPYSHIFVKEVVSIYTTVIWAQRVRTAMGRTGPSVFKIAVDSKAAAAATMRCYSSCSKINGLLLRLWNFLEQNDIVLECIDIHTKLNVADAPSRRMKITKALARATYDVLTGALPGRPEWLRTDAQVPSIYLPLIESIEIPSHFDTDVEDDVWDVMRRAQEYDDVRSKKRIRH